MSDTHKTYQKQQINNPKEKLPHSKGLRSRIEE
jgi:hypothetical protein